MISTNTQVLFSREEFIEELMSRTNDVVEVGRMVNFVEGAFRLQNDVARPAYVIEVTDDVTPDDIEYVSTALSQLGVCAVLVPPKMLRYVGTVTPREMGIDNIRSELWGTTTVDQREDDYGEVRDDG